MASKKVWRIALCAAVTLCTGCSDTTEETSKPVTVQNHSPSSATRPTAMKELPRGFIKQNTDASIPDEIACRFAQELFVMDASMDDSPTDAGARAAEWATAHLSESMRSRREGQTHQWGAMVKSDGWTTTSCEIASDTGALVDHEAMDLAADVEVHTHNVDGAPTVTYTVFTSLVRPRGEASWKVDEFEVVQ